MKLRPIELTEIAIKLESCLEKARKDLFATLDALRASTLSDKEADAVAAAIEDELIALRVGSCAGVNSRWTRRGVAPEDLEPVSTAPCPLWVSS